MRLIGKLLALPFMLVTGILYLVCKFLVVLSGAVLGFFLGSSFWRHWCCSLSQDFCRVLHGL
jgi:hypothetical protein